MLVRLNSTLRGRAGWKDMPLDLAAGAAVQDALAAVVARAPVLHDALLDETGGLRDDIVVFHNGRNIRFRASQKSQTRHACHPERVLHATCTTPNHQRRVSAGDGGCFGGPQHDTHKDF